MRVVGRSGSCGCLWRRRVAQVELAQVPLVVDLDACRVEQLHAREQALLIVVPRIHHGLEPLLAKWERFRGAVPAGSSYYLMPGERTRVLPASAVDSWLQMVLAHFKLQPPAQQSWSGHSLRKGAASAAAAIGVSLDRICFVGGWKIKAATVHDYIDPTCPASAAGRRFFGWLLPS